MKKLLIIALMFWGCDYAPTEHTHDDTMGICVMVSPITHQDGTPVEDNEYTCITGGEYQFSNDDESDSDNNADTYIVDEYHCELNKIFIFVEFSAPFYVSWISDASCEVYCEDILSEDTEASCVIFEE